MTNELIADAHTHVFNAGFLPIEGILMSRGVKSKLASYIAGFIEKMVERTWPPLATSLASKNAKQRQRLYEMLEQELTRPAKVDASGASDLIDRVVDAVPEDDLLAIDDGLTSAGTRPTSVGDRRDELKRLLHAADNQAGPVETGENLTRPRTMSVGSFIEWILLLLVHESRIEKAFSDAWDGKPRLDRRVHHMMDMECHYPSKRVLYPLSERHERMQAVAEKAKLPLVGFSAFDPFRRDCQQIIEGAIEAGFTGVKFYPPNGYRPIGNSASDIKNGPAPDEVNRRNMDLFGFCVRDDVPVFTHCNSGGMESRPKDKTGKFSDPAGWEQVLETRGLSSLRLCLGHAGGQEGWFSKTADEFDRSWAGHVFRLCTNPKYNNVYCDFGFFDQVLDGSAAKRFGARLLAAIEADKGFADKCCFGTDWHMIARIGSRKYISRFAAVLDGSPKLKEHASKLLRDNLLNYLKNP